jgi:DNA-binding CsgD family transcriptional regulator
MKGRGRKRSPRKNIAGAELTEVEIQMLKRNAERWSHQEIADEVKLSLKTVQRKLSKEEWSGSIYNKIGVDNREEARGWYSENFPPTTTQPVQTTLQSEAVFITISVIVLGLLLVTIFTFLYLPLWILPERTKMSEYYAGISLVMPITAAVCNILRLYVFHRDTTSPYSLPVKMFSLGLFCWSLGGAMWNTYNLAYDIEIPYPSLADVGYFSNGLFWMGGIYLLLNSTNRPPLKQRFWIFILWVFLIATSMVIIFIAHKSNVNIEGNTMKQILDIGYPIIDATNLMLLTVYLRTSAVEQAPTKTQWGLHIIRIAIAILFIGNLTFNVSTSLEKYHWLSYYNGSPIDFIFPLSFCAIGIGMLLFIFSQSQEETA